MPTESIRHYLMGPLAACKARLFLINSSLRAGTADMTPELQTDVQKQLKFLEEKLQTLQKRIEEVVDSDTEIETKN